MNPQVRRRIGDELKSYEKIEIVSPGNRLTIQDLGRRGSQRYGVSVSGVLDLQATVIREPACRKPSVFRGAGIDISVEPGDSGFDSDTKGRSDGCGEPTSTSMGFPCRLGKRMLASQEGP